MKTVKARAVERRARVTDRRRKSTAPVYPFVDSNGVKVMNDRRTMPDRRVSNIQVEWGEEIELTTTLK
jgi:hypothetical protein